MGKKSSVPPPEKILSSSEFGYITYNVGIVGAGSGCIAILEMVHGHVLKHFKINVVGVCDIRPDAPGMIAARTLNIPVVTTDIKDLFSIDSLSMIIELTGDRALRDEIFNDKPRDVELLDHVAAGMLWDLYEADLEKIEMEVKLQKKINDERNRIKQIFNNLPDAILVIDNEMIIRDVNRTFLDINGLREEDVVGKRCYEVENRLKGECQISDDYCPMQEVVSMKSEKKSIYHHIDKDTGADVYASTTISPLTDDRGNITGVIETSRDISYRIKLEEELVQSKIRLEKFMESAPFFIAIKNLSGQYIQINQRGCEDIGLPFQKIITKTDFEIFPHKAAQMIRQHDQKVFKDKKDFIIEETIIKDNVKHFYQTIRFPIFHHKDELNAICVISQNITPLREAQHKLELYQRKLEDTKEYLQSILENSGSIIITTDNRGNIVSFNRGAELLTGYSRDEVAGKPVVTLYSNPQDRADLIKKLEALQSVANIEMQIVRKDGSRIDVDSNISRLMDNTGALIGTVDIYSDITPRKQLQQQLIRTDRLAAIGKLGAGVAHEINNPVAIVGEAAGWVMELLEADGSSRKLKDYDEIISTINTIKKQASRITDITRRLLGFASQSESSFEKIDMNSVIREVVKLSKDLKNIDNIVVKTNLADGLPGIVLNEVQLEQTIVNIIDNAVDAIGDGKGEIQIATRLAGNRLVVEISDDGPGISPDVIDRIFDPFVTTKPVGKGTGLGLSICYGIVKQMGGDIEVESPHGAGALFRISFPVKDNRKII